MGSQSILVLQTVNNYSKKKKCLDQDAEKAARSRTRQRVVLQEQVSNFLLDVFTAYFGKETMPNELEPELQFTWQQLWSIYLLKYWNLRVMLPVITRKQELFQDTCSLQSGTTRNRTSFWLVSLSLKVECSQIFKLFSCPRKRRKAKPLPNSINSFLSVLFRTTSVDFLIVYISWLRNKGFQT